MHGATHAITGMAVGLGAATIAGEHDPARLALATGIGALSGLAPDWLQINVPGASRQIRGAFGHRGFSHWIWTPLFISWLVISTSALNLQNGLILAFLAAWGSHILLDAFANGVPAFWPFGRLTLGHVKTGGKLDKATGGAFLVVLVALAVAEI